MLYVWRDGYGYCSVMLGEMVCAAADLSQGQGQIQLYIQKETSFIMASQVLSSDLVGRRRTIPTTDCVIDSKRLLYVIIQTHI